MICIDLIAGGRPNFMKVAPKIDALQTARSQGSRIAYRLIHAGHHYDRAISGVPVSHVEGGIRSGDWTMPEEINRVVTDLITNWFFSTRETDNEASTTLRCNGRPYFFVENTMSISYSNTCRACIGQ